MKPDAQNPVLFFDGVCNLCNGAIQFVIKHDKQQKLLFASLQSEAGKKAISGVTAQYQYYPDSLLLFYKGKYYIQSDAVLRTAKLMGGAWSAFYVFIIIPRFIRDGLYRFVSRNRYKWYGKRDACMIPTPELKARFLS